MADLETPLKQKPVSATEQDSLFGQQSLHTSERITLPQERDTDPFGTRPLFAVLFVISLPIFYTISTRHYLLFHSLVECYSFVVAISIFVLTWNTRLYLEDSFLLFIGIAYLFIGSLDIIHTFAYKGMNVFGNQDANVPTQLWIAARYTESFSLLLALSMPGRQIKAISVLVGFSVVFTLILTSIFLFKIFPDCYREGYGLTAFKIYSEYAVVAILIISVALIVTGRSRFTQHIFYYLIMAVVFTAIAELAFTAYIHVYGFMNFAGHCFKVLSFYCIYRVIVISGIERPYNLLFRNIQLSNIALKEREKRLKELAGKLLDAQENERRRLAGELHDDLTQRLAILAIEAGRLEKQSGCSGPAAQTLRVIRDKLITLSEDVHTISRQLHPSIIEDLGLVDSLRSEINNFTNREGIPVRFDVEEENLSLPLDVAICFFRVAQEGLRNIGKHARAQSVRISLSHRNGSLLLTIKDDGIGFDPQAVRKISGIGLASMEERIRLVGGRLSVQSQPGEGTLITASLDRSKKPEAMEPQTQAGT
jgi:signal transduction histidine kinase